MYFEYYCHTKDFGKSCGKAPLFGITGSGCVCVCLPYSPWCMVAVWLANVHRPYSLRATDCELYFSFPLSLINECSDKQTSWAKGSISGRGGGMTKSETERGDGAAYRAAASALLS